MENGELVLGHGVLKKLIDIFIFHYKILHLHYGFFKKFAFFLLSPPTPDSAVPAAPIDTDRQTH